MKLQFKRLHPDAVLPKYSRDGDCGLDLTAISREIVVEDGINTTFVYNTGIAVKIPEGFVGLMAPRGSASKKSLVLANSLGILDQNFRGELVFKYKVLNSDVEIFNAGDRIGQLVIVTCPTWDLEEVSDLGETNRGTQSWGSSGI